MDFRERSLFAYCGKPYELVRLNLLEESPVHQYKGIEMQWSCHNMVEKVCR